VSERKKGRGRRLLWLLVVLALAAGALVTFRVGPPPTVEIESGLPGIGRSTEVRVTLEEPQMGLSEYKVELIQGEARVLLEEGKPTPLAPWKLWGERTRRQELTLEVGSAHQPQLRAGEAEIRVTAERAGTWARRPLPVVEALTLPVRLRPPSLEVLSSLHYLAQGGSEAVVYRVGPSAVRHGVEVGELWFPGYALPGGGPQERFALLAAPFDLASADGIRLLAEDDVGNRAETAFIDRYFPRPVESDRIELSDRFLEKVVPPILETLPAAEDRGDLLESYLFINGELRERNTRTLEELAAKTREEFLWSRPFLALPNSQVMSDFADRRTYVYQGREVDQQVHLGFDLASVRRAPIPSSNGGVVALARYFGIYGNAVVVDHGYGLMSLYGHLSSLGVSEGQAVERGDSLGRTGETGLAGGDHLHFTILLQGVPVTPVEWWDAGWIRDRIARKLGDAVELEL
jgi:murein DD-endopeptidase MepM/ murein hydrolase activator NlpD